MNILGISAGFHDASATVINQQGDILFAGHSERYSKRKHDSNLHSDLIKDAMNQLIGNEDLIKQYGKQSFDYIQGYSIENMVLDYIEIFKEVKRRVGYEDRSN